MKVGYIKNIHNEPSPNKVLSSMETAGAEKIIVEVCPNEDYQRMLLDSIQNMAAKDILAIQTLDDLGDNIVDIINVVEKLEEKDIGIQVLDIESYDTNDSCLQHIFRKNLLLILAWLEDKERNEIRKRQAKGMENIRALKARKGSGRPKKYSKYAKDPEDREVYFSVVNMLASDVPIKRIADTLNVSRNTIYTIREELKKEQSSEDSES